MESPTSILKDEMNYKDKAWQQYSLAELGNWIHLLVKRAEHRSDPTKKGKDLADARAYLDMIKAWIDAAEKDS